MVRIAGSFSTESLSSSSSVAIFTSGFSTGAGIAFGSSFFTSWESLFNVLLGVANESSKESLSTVRDRESPGSSTKSLPVVVVASRVDSEIVSGAR